MDYLHYTRSLQFTDAEYISANSPVFLRNLLQKVKNGEDTRRSITRFLHFHPINEFEPFLESLGLIPSEINRHLPRGLIFLSDDSVLLRNFHTLVNYGIPRSKIGKIFREATEILVSEEGILSSKLCSYEGIGLSKTSVIKIIASVPSLLTGDTSSDLVNVLEGLESMNIDREWIGRNISEENSYSWRRVLLVLDFIRQLDFSEIKAGDLVRTNPGFVLDNSGRTSLSVSVLMIKMGSSKTDLSDLFLNFPAMKLDIFLKNLRFSLQFLITIEMEEEHIKEVIRSHPLLLGSCSLKTPYSVLTSLSIGQKRLCKIIKEDPLQFKNWVLGAKIDRLPSCRRDDALLEHKENFLIRVGFAKDSKDLKRAVMKFRGKGDELEERYNCFVEAGLRPSDVTKMIKLAPHILNQTKDVLERKIDFLVNNLGYPLDCLVTFPAFMSFTLERITTRFLMYDWLKKEGRIKPNLAMSTVLATAEKVFLKRFVGRHPEGPKIWENLKKQVES
ncbi:transcription termination factor MTEF18, mitochondrial-like isoform X2 [Wolffia australiana]